MFSLKHVIASEANSRVAGILPAIRGREGSPNAIHRIWGPHALDTARPRGPRHNRLLPLPPQGQALLRLLALTLSTLATSNFALQTSHLRLLGPYNRHGSRKASERSRLASSSPMNSFFSGS